MRNYLQFVLREHRLLSFGFTFTFFSSFGQTFLISLFVPFFLTAFNLTNASFGSLYSLATLSSALTLPFAGKWIDHLPLKKFSLMVAMGLMLAAFTVSISWHVIVLFIGLLLLRLSGQGLSGHTAQTAMAKFFRLQRGKALSIANLGYPMGEAVLPLIITALIPILSWRGAWGGISVAIGILLIPFILNILSGKTEELTTPDTGSGDDESSPANYNLVLSDKRFYLLLPAVLLPSFWVTGLFLYQVAIAEQLGWSATLIASAFVAFAIARIISSLGVGPVIDKLSARQLFPYYLLPMGAGFLTAYFHTGAWSAFGYMFLLGMTMGFGGSIKSALWAEMYGEDSVGTIRSLFSSVMVLSTALSPFLMGWLIDHAVAMTSILLSAVTSVVLASGLALLAFQEKFWS
ncbi:MFS transporter [Fodinibius sediminis]|uniref:Predicted arabinose efflux permease, MFS family n=1 Tax=Fodinibius sediminis TaxID=1214077 RepID=A0A521CTW2_9BACT|nr:MFS transporter [Fodinibius sediminis]SMO62110.1 Predicted arabinose efflux permease, MFS family [Fodinibius sediminis]